MERIGLVEVVSADKGKEGGLIRKRSWTRGQDGPERDIEDEETNGTSFGGGPNIEGDTELFKNLNAERC